MRLLQVFYYALKAVVYPMAPVFDMQANDGAGALTPFCTMALKRIFLMSDLDKARPLRQRLFMLLPALHGHKPPSSIISAVLPYQGQTSSFLI